MYQQCTVWWCGASHCMFSLNPGCNLANMVQCMVTNAWLAGSLLLQLNVFDSRHS